MQIDRGDDPADLVEHRVGVERATVGQPARPRDPRRWWWPTAANPTCSRMRAEPASQEFGEDEARRPVQGEEDGGAVGAHRSTVGPATDDVRAAALRRHAASETAPSSERPADT